MNEKDLTPLEAFEYLKENKRRHWLDNDRSNECLSIIEKETKALEIIKEKVVVIPFLILHLSLNDLNGYNKAMDKKHKLMQEEFDLLKEVLL